MRGDVVEQSWRNDGHVRGDELQRQRYGAREDAGAAGQGEQSHINRCAARGRAADNGSLCVGLLPAVVHRASLVVAARAGAELFHRGGAGCGQDNRRRKSRHLEREPGEQHPRQVSTQEPHTDFLD